MFRHRFTRGRQGQSKEDVEMLQVPMEISWHGTNTNLRMKSPTSKCKYMTMLHNIPAAQSGHRDTGRDHHPREQPALGTAESRAVKQ